MVQEPQSNSKIFRNIKHGLLTLRKRKANANLIISSKLRQGNIQVRNGEVVSSHSGILHGNGALLSLAQLKDAQYAIEMDGTQTTKTIHFSSDQIDGFFDTLRTKANSLSPIDEERELQIAKKLIFQFRHKTAMEKLVTILKYNRFFYPAWLWQSRLLKREDHISKAIDEAYKWGNHDQEIWREYRKIKPQITNSKEQAKRCIFCWSFLGDSIQCPYCNALVTFSNRAISDTLKAEEVKVSVRLFEKSFYSDRNNYSVAYAIALGNFNLGNKKNSLEYVRRAAQLSPKTVLFQKAQSFLECLQGNAPQKRSIGKPKEKKSTSATDTSILVIEDSKTSRKVINMLLKRFDLNTLEAATGKEALEIGSRETPSLILLDVTLPDTDGHTLLPKLKSLEHLKQTPVIMLTARHDVKDRLRGIDAGVNEYVTKPFNPQKLDEIITKYLPSINRQEINRTIPGSQQEQHSDTVSLNHRSIEGVTSSIIAPTALSAQNKNPDHSKSIKQESSGSNKSIFVIEDSGTSRKVLSMILKRNGFTIHEAATGDEAIQVAPTITPDLILLDVMLPDTTGLEILPKLKELKHLSSLPVIMLTGKDKATDRMKGMLAGTNEYLTKPFNPEKLLSVIGGYI